MQFHAARNQAMQFCAARNQTNQWRHRNETVTKQSCIRDVVSIGPFTWRCNKVLNTLINALDVKFYWFTARL